MSYRTSTALPSSKKTHSDKHKQILKQLLKEGPNKTCADCKTSAHPRWASWSLGCFICIRCSGIHRSMGTHISKVKSVDLDAWTDEQVELMVRWGNERCNAYWEAKLPDGYVPDQSKIENFIRTKYDLKKWVASPNIPNPLSIKTPVKNEHKHKKSPSIGSKQPASANDSLLDDDFGIFTSLGGHHSTQNSAPASTTSIPNNLNQTSRTATPVASAHSTGGTINNGRPDLKKSILSLYSSPSSSTSGFIQPRNTNTLSQGNNQVNNLSNSLSGLNFQTHKSESTSTLNSSNKLNAPQTISKPSTYSSTTQNQTPWNNEWTGTYSGSNSSNQWSSSNNNSIVEPSAATIKTSSLDDDLFKNVWQ
ncbi:uncharacterized protein PRCAT00005442001 [Priceomyces carsonii]|uniref:uncharacterized protein n=1 Tax=Priceomyces carsonii TaxID=28549 RepID=UPI002EDA9350|nr:unnamed protein product [Priceomyces carsonii]